MTEDATYIRDIIETRSVVAYKALVEKYETQVFTLCFKIVKGREEAEEVAQDTFVQCFKKLKDLNDWNKFPNWLLKIAYSKAIDRVRKKQLQRIGLDTLDNAYIKEEQTPLKEVMMTNSVEVLHGAINQLEPEEASVITLYYLQELPVKEVADITGLSPSNVKVKLFRARKNLKTLLENHLKTDVNDIIP